MGCRAPRRPRPGESPAEGATEREVAAELDLGQDRRSEERLRATFVGVEALGAVRVAVNAGVVRLTGEVPSNATRELAGQLARQIEGRRHRHRRGPRGGPAPGRRRPARNPGRARRPAAQALVEELGESNVVIRYLGWVDQRAADFLAVKSEAIRRVKEALDEAGISLPEPTYRVRLRRDEARLEKPAPALLARPQPPADIARRRVVERQADAQRAAEGPDLLDPAAAREL